MRYQGCLLVVKNASFSRDFYQNLFGCEVELDLGDYVILKGGIMLQQEDTWLGFIKKGPDSVAYRNHAAELYFEEADFDAFLARLAADSGMEMMSPVSEHEWGQRSIRFYDPDGHVLEVGEDMKAVVKRFLDSGMTVEEAAARSMFPADFVRECLAELPE